MKTTTTTTATNNRYGHTGRRTDMYYLSHGQPHAIFRENLNMLKTLQCCGQNGKPINPAVHLETVEDVQPTGKRVNIPSAVRNANYTCVVTSHVASTSATAHLFVTSECCSCCVNTHGVYRPQ